jgi:hypothetical protein
MMSVRMKSIEDEVRALDQNANSRRDIGTPLTDPRASTQHFCALPDPEQNSLGSIRVIACDEQADFKQILPGSRSPE